MFEFQSTVSNTKPPKGIKSLKVNMIRLKTGRFPTCMYLGSVVSFIRDTTASNSPSHLSQSPLPSKCLLILARITSASSFLLPGKWVSSSSPRLDKLLSRDSAAFLCDFLDRVIFSTMNYFGNDMLLGLICSRYTMKKVKLKILVFLANFKHCSKTKICKTTNCNASHHILSRRNDTEKRI